MNTENERMRDREAPADVEPVIHGDTRYEVIHWGKGRDLGQNGGYIAAYDNETDEELWLLKVYHIDYSGPKEGDHYDNFITELTLSDDGKSLLLKNEDHESYIVDLEARTAKPQN